RSIRGKSLGVVTNDRWTLRRLVFIMTLVFDIPLTSNESLRKQRWRLLVMTISAELALWCLLLSPGQAENPPKPDGAKELKAAQLDYMKKIAGSYDIVLSDDPAKKMSLLAEPLLRFDDQVTGVIDGTLFIWMLDDRPGATASVWFRKNGQEFHEF